MIRLALFFLVLFLVAVSDIRKRIIPDWMPFLIAGVSLIPSEPVYLTGLFVALPLLIAGITVGGIGGGDIKLMAACGFFLGLEKGFLAAVTGLALAVLVQGAFLRNRNVPFALIPYLAAGCLAANFIK